MLALARRSRQVPQPGVELGRAKQCPAMKQGPVLLPCRPRFQQAARCRCKDFPGRAVGAPGDVGDGPACRPRPRSAQRVNDRRGAADRAEQIVTTPAVDQQRGPKLVGGLLNRSLERRKQGVDLRPERRAKRRHEGGPIAFDKLDQLQAEPFRDGARVAALVAVAGLRREVDAGKAKAGLRKARGNDRRVEAAGQPDGDGSGARLSGNDGQSGLPQAAGGLGRVIDRLIAPDERSGVPSTALVPGARACPGQQPARQHFAHAREPRPARPQERELQPMREEQSVYLRPLGQAERNGQLRIRGEDRLVRLAQSVHRDRARGLAIDDRLLARSAKECEIAPVAGQRRAEF